MLRFTTAVVTNAAHRTFATSAMLLGSHTGKVVSYNRQKGFGFIEEGEGERKATHFVHWSALNCEGGFKGVEVGTAVEFDVANDERNPEKTRASNVTAVGGSPLPAPARPTGDNFRGGGGGGGFRGRGRGGDRDGGNGGYRGGRGGRGGYNRDGGNGGGYNRDGGNGGGYRGDRQQRQDDF